MKKPILKTVSSNMQQKEKVRKNKDESLNTAISQIEQNYGKGSIMKLGDNKQECRCGCYFYRIYWFRYSIRQ